MINNYKFLLFASHFLLSFIPLVSGIIFIAILACFAPKSGDQMVFSGWAFSICVGGALTIQIMVSLWITYYVKRKCAVTANNCKFVITKRHQVCMCLSTFIPFLVQFISWIFTEMVLKNGILAILSMFTYFPAILITMYIVYLCIGGCRD